MAIRMREAALNEYDWPTTVRFLALAAAWNVLLFIALRTSWVIDAATLPMTQFQAMLAAAYGPGASAPVVVTLECSGADVMALCAGVILAFPAPWRRRLIGVATVLPVLFALNVIRIGTLSMAAGSPARFEFLHLYAWPTVLVAVSAAMVFAWMRPSGRPMPSVARAAAVGVAGFGAFAVAVPWLWSSSAVAASCHGVAGAAARVMAALGANAVASGPLLTTPRGAFVVTPDCLLSPIIPLWIIGALWWPLTRWQRVAALALTIPVVGALATARLLVLAAPGAWVQSPLVVVHGFHQLVLFAAVVMTTAIHGADRIGSLKRAVTRGVWAVCLSAVAALVAGPIYNSLVLRAVELLTPLAPHARLTLMPASDVQGALAMLPVFQAALLWAMVWAFGMPIRRLHFGAALAATLLSQVLLLVALGELSAHAGFSPHALMLRGWAVLLPVALAFAVLQRSSGAVNPRDRDLAYRHFWDQVGAEFPDLGGASSTRLYFENEQRLFRGHLPNLAGMRVLKTDLWDEARNSRILQWVQQQGARVAGIDISGPVVRMARAEFKGAPFEAAGGDVRALPFGDRTFDAIYSMGTIEHFDETEQAVAELFRVLKPGGRAMVGVPNRHDPFLRPLLVAALYRLGLYDYGFEKSYSRQQLQGMLRAAGFSVVGDDGILFMPGWLRMADLLCHTRLRRLAPLTGAAVGVFAWLDAHVPAVRRHGYLVVAVGERPAEARPDRIPSAVGHEWIVDARGCHPQLLRSVSTLKALFAEIVGDLHLKTIGEPRWHAFDGEGGVTGLQMLSESHLACHTYPEARYAAFSLYCCRPDLEEWPWRERLSRALGATSVAIRMMPRGPADGPPDDAGVSPTS